MNSPLLSLSISAGYAGKPGILRQVSLDVQEGEIVGLVGRSISRASSLRQVAGFVEPAGGDLNDLSAAQLQELLQTVEQGGADQGGEAVSAQDVGLEDLSTSELRALLQSLEG